MQKPTLSFSDLSNQVIGCAIEVHRTLGPGLLESTYKQCLAKELQLNGISFELEKAIDIDYKGTLIKCAYRADIIVQEEVLLELKSVDAIQGIHQAQLITYLKLAGIRHGLLINFNVNLLKDGIKSFVI